jgi:hypothetical protein
LRNNFHSKHPPREAPQEAPCLSSTVATVYGLPHITLCGANALIGSFDPRDPELTHFSMIIMLPCMEIYQNPLRTVRWWLSKWIGRNSSHQLMPISYDRHVSVLVSCWEDKDRNPNGPNPQFNVVAVRINPYQYDGAEIPVGESSCPYLELEPWLVQSVQKRIFRHPDMMPVQWNGAPLQARVHRER